MLDTVIDFIQGHEATVVMIAGILYELCARLVPTVTRGSIFSKIGKLLFLISDLIGKVVPDKRKEVK